jgi:diketogulonate reductase-like aldo/keto reductase
MAAALPLLHSGMPPIGIGTYELRGDDCVRAVRAALQMGYRLIDTAAVYRNEDLVGEGIATSGVPRDELYVVVKIAMKSMGTEDGVRAGILESLQKLRIAYADCVLMHWPGCGGLKPDDAAGHHGARARCWRVMKELQREGKVRYLGVSNFLPRHFAELRCFDDDNKNNNSSADGATLCNTIASTATPQGAASTAGLYALPVVNQVELHPLCVQRDVDDFCRGRHGMVLQQYSPLGKGDAQLLRHPRLLDIHARYFSYHTAATAAATTASTSQSPASGSDDTGKKRRTETEGTAEEPYFYSLHDLLLIWGLARGYCTLVRSHNPEHLQANLSAARDYYASIQQSSNVRDGAPARPLLTAEQLEVIHHLRRYMGVEDAKDVHLCWYSDTIA